MMPRPPTWMSPRITASPKPDQYDGVSTTTRPVTQTALVAVKSDSRRVAPPSPERETGSRSRTVPAAMAPAKPSTTTCAGWRRRRRLVLSLVLSLAAWCAPEEPSPDTAEG